MEENNENAEPAQTAQVEEEHIHLPSPSWAPIILALGLAGIVFGVVLTPVLLILGVVVTVIGLGMWIMDEIHNATASDGHGNNQASNHAA